MNKLASALKQKADSLHKSKHNKEVGHFIRLVHEKASLAADEGRYQIEMYDDDLLNSDFAEAVKKKLKDDGFKVTIAEDSHYTEHVGKTMMYLKLSWK